MPCCSRLIPWSAIYDVTTWRYKGQKAIVLHLYNPENSPGRGLAGILARFNRAVMGGDIGISLTLTNRSFDEAIAAIERFRLAASPDPQT